MTVQLIAIDGSLYYPAGTPRDAALADYFKGEDIILVHRYPEGDADTIKWPNPNRKVLTACLYDDRETGMIEDEEVLLPDGTSAWEAANET